MLCFTLYIRTNVREMAYTHVSDLLTSVHICIYSNIISLSLINILFLKIDVVIYSSLLDVVTNSIFSIIF